MIDKRVSSVDEAIHGLFDGATLMVSGFGGAGVPVELIKALDRSKITDLNIVINAVRFLEMHAPGLFQDHRVKSLVCSAFRGRDRDPSHYERQWQAGELAIDLSPQGSFSERIRAGGAGIPAFFTPTAAGTQLAEGKEVREFDGRQCILETAIKGDFAFLRAAEADRFGNLRFRGTQSNFGPIMAMASKVAVAEVASFSDKPLEADQIHLSGVFIDRILVASETGV
jgi:3-oxoadipate CoA-transferase alpha subunit